jgi:hypothetical protein
MSKSLKNQVSICVFDQLYDQLTTNKIENQIECLVYYEILKTLAVEYFMQFTTKIFNHVRKDYE